MIPIRPLMAELDRVYRRLDQAGHVLVALDYDGTLAPIAGRPQDAALSPDGVATLNELAAKEGYSLAIVSGRSLADLRQRLPLDVLLAGNHGLEIEGRGVSFVHPGALETRSAVDHACWDLEAALHAIPGVLVERKELTATVHYRQAPAELTTWIQSTVEAVFEPYRQALALVPARRALELRPKLHWNKGSAVRLLLDRLGRVSPALVCAGDDATDEDMFRISRWEVSIKVGAPRYTRARYYVREVPQLMTFLELLAERPSSAGGGRRAAYNSRFLRPSTSKPALR